MKKYITFLLCFIMVLPLLSCGIGGDNTPEESGNSSQITPPQNENTNYDRVIELYRNIINVCQDHENGTTFGTWYLSELGITNTDEKILISEILHSAYLFYPGRGQKDSPSPHYKIPCGYAIKDLNGDGIDELVFLNDDYTVVAVLSSSDGKLVLLGTYAPRDTCWIDGEGLIHNYGSNGAFGSTNIVYKIADGGACLEPIIEYGSEGYRSKYGDYRTKYYKSTGGEKTEISINEYKDIYAQYGKYSGMLGGEMVTREHSGLEFKPLFSEADIVMEMYDAVLKNKVKVYETDSNELNFLKKCRTPYTRAPFYTLDRFDYTYIDMDGDTVAELVINCGDTLILRYYDGKVYAYTFTFNQMYQLNDDGSYNWNENAATFEYGESRLAFDGSELKTNEIWKVVNDGKPDAKYYIDGAEVIETELTKYIKDNPKSLPEYTSVEISWDTMLTLEQAKEIASHHWGWRDGEGTGACGTTIIPVFVVSEVPTENSDCYRIILRLEYYSHAVEGWENSAPHQMRYKAVAIDAYTGECVDEEVIVS